MPLAKMDMCLYGRDHSIAPSELATMVGLTIEQVIRAYSMIERKRANARYLHMPPATFAEEQSR